MQGGAGCLSEEKNAKSRFILFPFILSFSLQSLSAQFTYLKPFSTQLLISCGCCGACVFCSFACRESVCLCVRGRKRAPLQLVCVCVTVIPVLQSKVSNFRSQVYHVAGIFFVVTTVINNGKQMLAS